MEKRKPGRPKKAQPSNEPGSVVTTPDTQLVRRESTPDREPVAPKIELNDVAFSVTRDPKTQHWLVLEIPYDIKSGQVGEIKRIEMNSERIIILERLEVLVHKTFHK